MGVAAALDGVLDVAFPLAGTQLPRDHAWPLAQALSGQLAWLAADPQVGIHPVKVVAGYGARGWLSQRARLLIRVPGARVAELAPLSGRWLDVAGCVLRLGEPKPRDLVPHSTLYAHLVAAESDDETVFVAAVASTLSALEIDAHVVCGGRQQIGAPGRAISGFSLMLHGLTPDDSLRMQRAGLGPQRLLGCGVFVPHRSAAAVGA
ncbi:CRISPR-associated endonuclease Cas6 [Burkholderiaceae bacterium]|nr:CRISPR-associated endonuclease Cas6 [Burkholderiaceae bacterium]